MVIRMLIAGCFCLVAACSARGPIRSELVKAGVAPTEADCLAVNLDRDLSVPQLQRLGRAVGEVKRARGGTTGPVTYGEIVAVATRLDVETIGAIGKAGVICSLGNASVVSTPTTY